MPYIVVTEYNARTVQRILFLGTILIPNATAEINGMLVNLGEKIVKQDAEHGLRPNLTPFEKELDFSAILELFCGMI